MKKVAVIGAKGRMGKTVCEAIKQTDDLELCAEITRDNPLILENLNGAEVAVEFTVPPVSVDNVLRLLDYGIDVVAGSSGWEEKTYALVQAKALETGRRVLIVPNFALSAVLVMKFSALAAPYFASTEIVETHHPLKLDAPSGTAVATAKLINQAREKNSLGSAPDATISDDLGARGGKIGQVRLHSLRLSGANAHQEVVFGNPGECLTIKTDCYDRWSYMPGVLLAVREIERIEGLEIGLDKVMEL